MEARPGHEPETSHTAVCVLQQHSMNHVYTFPPLFGTTVGIKTLHTQGTVQKFTAFWMLSLLLIMHYHES